MKTKTRTHLQKKVCKDIELKLDFWSYLDNLEQCIFVPLQNKQKMNFGIFTFDCIEGTD
jgi:hypothetical protein